MRLAVLLGTAIASVAILNGCIIAPSQAIQLRDGTVYFVEPPRLVEAATTYNQVNIWGATYYRKFGFKTPSTSTSSVHRF